MKILAAILVVLLLLLQYRLWLGEDSLPDAWRMEKRIAVQRAKNTALEERNRTLEAEVRDLKKGQAAIEERAREELGMIKEGETFFQVVHEPSATPPEKNGSGERTP